MPAERFATDWLPSVAELLMPGPITETEVAFVLVQEIVELPGEPAVVGSAVIEAVTIDGAATVTVTLCVAEPPLPRAVMV